MIQYFSRKAQGVENLVKNRIYYITTNMSESRDSNPESHEPESCMLPLHYSPYTPILYRQFCPFRLKQHNLMSENRQNTIHQNPTKVNKNKKHISRRFPQSKVENIQSEENKSHKSPSRPQTNGHANIANTPIPSHPHCNSS